MKLFEYSVLFQANIVVASESSVEAHQRISQELSTIGDWEDMPNGIGDLIGVVDGPTLIDTREAVVSDLDDEAHLVCRVNNDIHG